MKLRDRFQSQPAPIVSEQEAQALVGSVTDWLHDKVIRHPTMTITELLTALHSEELSH